VSHPARPATRLDALLAALLQYGTWLASIVVLTGSALALFGAHRGGHASSLGSAIVGYGIALFVLMPVLRVCTMCVFFVRARDRLALVAALVLLVMGAGLVLGRMVPRKAP